MGLSFNYLYEKLMVMTNTLVTRVLKTAAILSLLYISGTHDLSAEYNYYGRSHFYGGYIGVDMGLVNQFEASPIAGYRITHWWHAGAGAKYQYYNDKRIGEVFRTHIYGPLLFTDIIPVHNLNDVLPIRFLEAGIFVHGEVNIFSLPVRHFDSENRFPDQNRFFRPTWITGIGLRSTSDTGRHLNIMIIFDVSDHERKVYANPALRLGYMF